MRPEMMRTRKNRKADSTLSRALSAGCPGLRSDPGPLLGNKPSLQNTGRHFQRVLVPTGRRGVGDKKSGPADGLGQVSSGRGRSHWESPGGFASWPQARFSRMKTGGWSGTGLVGWDWVLVRSLSEKNAGSHGPLMRRVAFGSAVRPGGPLHVARVPVVTLPGHSSESHTSTPSKSLPFTWHRFVVNRLPAPL